MFKRLVKRGNNLALVIDRPTLDLLHIDAETFLDIQIQGKSLVVTPVHADDRKKKFLEACREHIICPVFVARDLSGLGWSLKEGHYDAGTGTTGGETDAV